MNLGDTFVNIAVGQFRSHLWAVVSHPDGANRVVIVNVSSDDDGLGDLETLKPPELPWLSHNSFIRTDMALLSPITAIQAALTSNPPAVTAKGPLAAATLTKLQRALGKSKHTALEIKRLLREQGFI